MAASAAAASAVLRRSVSAFAVGAPSSSSSSALSRVRTVSSSLARCDRAATTTPRPDASPPSSKGLGGAAVSGSRRRSAVAAEGGGRAFGSLSPRSLPVAGGARAGSAASDRRRGSPAAVAFPGILRSASSSVPAGAAAAPPASGAGASSLAGYDLSSPSCNVPPHIASRVGRNLHLTPGHPLHTIKSVIYDHFSSLPNGCPPFETRDEMSPVVSTHHNFDSLLIPKDHVSRSKSDTYYLDDETVLRTHTSAHQTTLLAEGLDRFLVTGDVYRRDEIDGTHYPVFHQMEGVRIFTEEELAASGASTEEEGIELAERDLKLRLEGLARALFGSDVETRWVGEYFPFTDPSFELEVMHGGEWLEVLGCGVVHRDIIQNAGLGTRPGWAFGLGLERLAMVLFSIPDIRLFWTDDERFHSQFEPGRVDVTFEPYSKYPPCFKDISFWIDEGMDDDGGSDDGPDAAPFHENDFYEVVRDAGGDLVERVELIDEFLHPKTGRTSKCYRISYRSMDRSLTNEEVDLLQERVRTGAVEGLGVELR